MYVGHNKAATKLLRTYLKRFPCNKTRYADMYTNWAKGVGRLILKDGSVIESHEEGISYKGHSVEISWLTHNGDIIPETKWGTSELTIYLDALFYRITK